MNVLRFNGTFAQPGGAPLGCDVFRAIFARTRGQ